MLIISYQNNFLKTNKMGKIGQGGFAFGLYMYVL